ncbi:RLA class II histocompatibility antigen, DP alpha-1 chain-like [Centroberyx affinis]|uniref:RLA class II histocompatibility antigen, DP alpha-1 chain-like n=1 Tax=Centroberyx affinis TaxID=166261 RepID=UPI003A5C05BE
MDFLLVSLVLSHIGSTAAAVHEATLFYGCWQSGEAQVQAHWDGDQLLYADFDKERAVWTAPLLADLRDTWLGFYILARISRERVCKVYLPAAAEADKDPPEERAPTVVLYPQQEAELGAENTLFCYVSRFYPPSVNISWSRNGVELTEGVALSNLLPEPDGTFSRLVGLSFSPEAGAKLGCRVEHRALPHPRTTTWEFPSRPDGPGSSVLLGVGLTLGFLCLAAGAVLFYRAPRPTDAL